MGNTLGIVDFSVESLDEIREKSQESKINTKLTKYEIEMNHLNDISQNYVNSRISIPPRLLKIRDNTIYGYSYENVHIVAIYDIIQNSIKIIHSADPLYIEKVFHKSNHDDFFVSSTSMDYTKEIYHYGTEKLEEWDIDSRFNCKLVKSIRNFNFASISYFKAKFIQKINYIGEYVDFLNQIDSTLILNSDYKVLHVDLDKNEVEKKLESNFLDISVTENFIFSPKNGFRNIRTNQQMEFISFRCISKNEVFLLTFNAQKSIGEIFYLHNYHIDPDVEPVASFSIIGVSDQIYFSDDSEFVFILEKNKTECNLLVFSIRETKFVFRKKFIDQEIDQITIQNNFILCSCSYFLIDVLEINIPIRLKPYLIHSPTDIHFNFK
jgi:hypothetical protein